MRSEKEMYDLILGYANADENIRAVILNGSRANPNRKPDPFNDFDIVYLVRDLTPCKEKAYYKDFGEILVCERTDETVLPKGTGSITDVGMTGPIESVLGVRAELVIKKQISKMPVRFDFADGPCKLDCILFDIDEKTGLTRSTERFSLR